MLKFNEFLQELSDTEVQLDEALLQFGGRKATQFGQVVLLQGGAGSGKGFVLSNLVGLEGRVFDVDELKKLSMRAPGITKTVKDKYGVEFDKLDLRNTDDVSTLHDVIGSELRLPKKQQAAFYTSILASHPDRKPNIIFDSTLKDMQKLDDLVRDVVKIGYKKENIHIVWIVNDVEVQKMQNQQRDRRVKDEILVSTHVGAANTMRQILDMGETLQSYMDGYIYLVFNKATVKTPDGQIVSDGDSDYVMGAKKDNVIFTKREPTAAAYVKETFYVTAKQKGKKQVPTGELGEDVLNKIRGYVPALTAWEPSVKVV